MYLEIMKFSNSEQFFGLYNQQCWHIPIYFFMSVCELKGMMCTKVWPMVSYRMNKYYYDWWEIENLPHDSYHIFVLGGW